VVIMPTNRRLAATSANGSAETRALLERWNTLHGIRTTLSVVALVIFLVAR
jgi:hypothetical protein